MHSWSLGLYVEGRAATTRCYLHSCMDGQEWGELQLHPLQGSSLCVGAGAERDLICASERACGKYFPPMEQRLTRNQTVTDSKPTFCPAHTLPLSRGGL